MGLKYYKQPSYSYWRRVMIFRGIEKAIRRHRQIGELTK